MLEVSVGILGGASCHRFGGVEGALAELGQSLAVEQRLQVLIVEIFNFLYLVAGAETVEEVYKRHACADGAEMSHTGQIHHFLHTAFGQHGKACLAHCHNVLMVAEDAESMAGNGTCRYMKDARQQFAGYLVHVGYHEQQTLRGCVCACQCATLKRSVNGSGSACLALHLLNQYALAEQVLAACCRPVVYILGHRR